MGDEGFDALPVDNCSWANVTCEGAMQEPAQNAATRRVDSDDFPYPIHARELDLIRADKARADEVDEVPRRQILRQQQLTSTTLKLAEVERLSFEANAPALDACDALHGHEELSNPDASNQARNRRMCLLAKPDDQVFNPTDALPALIH